MPRPPPPILTPVDSNALLNWARWVLRARTDHELATILGVTAPQISKIRHGRPLKALLLANLLDATNVKLRELEKKVRLTPEDWRERVKAGAKKQVPDSKTPRDLRGAG